MRGTNAERYRGPQLKRAPYVAATPLLEGQAVVRVKRTSG